MCLQIFFASCIKYKLQEMWSRYLLSTYLCFNMISVSKMARIAMSQTVLLKEMRFVQDMKRKVLTFSKTWLWQSKQIDWISSTLSALFGDSLRCVQLSLSHKTEQNKCMGCPSPHRTRTTHSCVRLHFHSDQLTNLLLSAEKECTYIQWPCFHNKRHAHKFLKLEYLRQSKKVCKVYSLWT